MFYLNNKTLCFLLSYIGLLDLALWIILLAHPGNIMISSTAFLCVRGIYCAAAFLFIKYTIKLDNPILLGLFSSILFFLFGIIGLFVMYFVFNAIAESSSQAATLYHIDKEEGEGTSTPDIAGGPAPIKFDELREVAPLADGMTDADTKLRIATIHAIEETDSTRLFNVLVDSRKDQAKEVQYFAHEALKKASDFYMNKIKKCMDIINKSEPRYENFKELADLYAELAHKNIEHPILVSFYRKEAIKYYSDLLTNFQEHRDAILSNIIPVLYENGDFKECIQYCDKLYRAPKLSTISIEFKARCLFQMRDMNSLRKLAQQEKQSNIPAINHFNEVSALGSTHG